MKLKLDVFSQKVGVVMSPVVGIMTFDFSRTFDSSSQSTNLRHRQAFFLFVSRFWPVSIWDWVSNIDSIGLGIINYSNVSVNETISINVCWSNKKWLLMFDSMKAIASATHVWIVQPYSIVSVWFHGFCLFTNFNPWQKREMAVCNMNLFKILVNPEFLGKFLLFDDNNWS